MNNYFSVILFWIVVFLFIGSVIYLGFKVVANYEKSRINDFKKLAAENGWEFDKLLSFSFLDKFAEKVGKNRRDVFGKISDNPLTGRGRNGLRGNFNGLDFAVFEQSYVYDNTIKTQTFFVAEIENMNLPLFCLEPAAFSQSLFSKLNKVFTMDQFDVNFDSHPVFSKDYRLHGQSEINLRRLFAPKVLNFYDNKPLLTTIGGWEYLFIYEDDRVYEPNQIVERLKFLYRLVNLLKHGREN